MTVGIVGFLEVVDIKHYDAEGEYTVLDLFVKVGYSYAGNLGYLLGWLDYIMTNVSPELSVKDLGFYIYFR